MSDSIVHIDTIVNENLEKLIDRLQSFPELYRHRLIVVVQPFRAESPFSLSIFAQTHGCQYINVNRELSKRLLEMSLSQRLSRGFQLLCDEIVGRASAEPVILEHIEALFDPTLQLSPVDCLLQLARYRLVIARWKGQWVDGHLVYAEPGHPEYCRHPTEDIQVLSIE